MSKIYTSEGWLNWPYIWDQTKAFCMIVGARGTGKTYGILRLIAEQGKRFIYLRRLQTQLEVSATEDGNPFKKVNTDIGINIAPPKKHGKGIIKFYKWDDENESDLVGYGLALSTFASIRGVDFSDVDCIVFDESVPMASERPVKNEFNSFLNFYETVNRNREIEGKAPVKCFLLGNANQLNNPYFAGWHFMTTALKMLSGHQMVWRTPENDRIMIMLQNSKISEQKKSTALYKNASSEFIQMAADNAFLTDATLIKPVNIKECIHLVSVGEIGIYKRKGNGDIHITGHVNKDHYYDGYGIRLRMFRSDYRKLFDWYLLGLLYFDSFELELLFRHYFNIT